jgi:predicted Zn-dependent protease
MLTFGVRALISVTALTLLTSCGVNPVTHKREFQIISESEEISMGEKNYLPARQQQGGDYTIDPELTAYVQSVGKRIAAVADRQLPYEFVVLNDSVPNAWAMPGGKIAFNRGLLYELNSEAELAAVLSHEIVHAAARHGAQSMEKGLLLQGAVMAAGIAAQDKSYANLVVGGAQLSSQLIATKFGRDDESEADLYGMQYMKKAGYDPYAAVTLQETFVRLSQDHHPGFIEGLFASHPPSEERVAANKATLATLGEGGEWGREVYAKKVGKLKATQVAYKDYEESMKTLGKGDSTKAAELAKKAVAAEPREARFQELLGDIALSKKQHKEALGYYDKAIKMQPDYFRPHVQGGIALNNLGRKSEAETYLKRSNELLPTAPSFYLLGQLSEERGDVETALKHYETASSSDSSVGKFSTERYLRLDLPRNPAKYLQATAQIDGNSNLYVSVLNSAPVAVTRVRVRAVRYDPTTNRPIAQSQPLVLSSAIAANQRGQIAVPGMRSNTPAELKFYTVTIEAAEVAQ